MFKAPSQILLLALLVCAVPASAQVASKPAAVKLVARVQESFALNHAPMPGGLESSEEPSLNPKGVLVGLNWRLRHGRAFQVGYALEDEVGGQPTILSEGTLVHSQIQDAIPIFSFRQSVPQGVQPIRAWGDRETASVGLAGIMLSVPRGAGPQNPTLRLRAIIL